MPFESQKVQQWADDSSEKDSLGSYVHKLVQIGDEVRGSVPPKCIERGFVKEVDKIRGRSWGEIPSLAPGAEEEKPAPALPIEPSLVAADLQPVDVSPVAVPNPEPVAEPKPAPKRKAKAKRKSWGAGDA